MRLPNDHEPDPPGGRSAERLREFLDEHLPPSDPSAEAGKPEDDPEAESGDKPTRTA